jgi:hypothetical protein
MRRVPLTNGDIALYPSSQTERQALSDLYCKQRRSGSTKFRMDFGARRVRCSSDMEALGTLIQLSLHLEQ